MPWDPFSEALTRWSSVDPPVTTTPPPMLARHWVSWQRTSGVGGVDAVEAVAGDRAALDGEIAIDDEDAVASVGVAAEFGAENDFLGHGAAGGEVEPVAVVVGGGAGGEAYRVGDDVEAVAGVVLGGGGVEDEGLAGEGVAVAGVGGGGALDDGRARVEDDDPGPGVGVRGALSLAHPFLEGGGGGDVDGDAAGSVVRCGAALEFDGDRVGGVVGEAETLEGVAVGNDVRDDDGGVAGVGVDEDVDAVGAVVVSDDVAQCDVLGVVQILAQFVGDSVSAVALERGADGVEVSGEVHAINGVARGVRVSDADVAVGAGGEGACVDAVAPVVVGRNIAERDAGDDRGVALDRDAVVAVAGGAGDLLDRDVDAFYRLAGERRREVGGGDEDAGAAVAVEHPADVLPDRDVDALDGLARECGGRAVDDDVHAVEGVAGGEAGGTHPRANLLFEPVRIFANNDPDKIDLLLEIFIPQEKFSDFVPIAAHLLRNRSDELLNVTVREIARDTDSALPYAKEKVFGLVMLFTLDKTVNAEKKFGDLNRDLIECALDHGGTFYLPYRNHASSSQLNRAYPELDSFLAAKGSTDPQSVFASGFHDYLLAARKEPVGNP